MNVVGHEEVENVVAALEALLLELVMDVEVGIEVVDETACMLVETEAEDEDAVEVEAFELTVEEEREEEMACVAVVGVVATVEDDIVGVRLIELDLELEELELGAVTTKYAAVAATAMMMTTITAMAIGAIPPLLCGTKKHARMAYLNPLRAHVTTVVTMRVGSYQLTP